MRLIMILGHAHSSSTLTGILLGSSPDVTFTGEEYDFFRENALEDYCTCGKKVSDCPFWAEVNDLLAKQVGADFRSRMQDLHKGLNRDTIYFLNKKFPCDEDCMKILEAYYKILYQVSGTKYILSGTKKIYYSRKVLENIFGSHALKYIITVRNPFGAMASYLRRGVSFLQSLRIIGTFYVMAKLAVPKNVRYIVKYENWINNPVEFFSNLSKELNIQQPQWKIEYENNTIAIQPVKQIHIFAGNKIRKKDKHVIQEDTRWKTELSSLQKLIISTTLLPVYKILY